MLTQRESMLLRRIPAAPAPVVRAAEASQPLAQRGAVAFSDIRVGDSAARKCTPRHGLFKYGCYCGYKSSCEPDLDCPPMDDLDRCCQTHDKAYGKCNFLDRFRPATGCFDTTAAADKDLCACASNLPATAPSNAKNFADGVKDLFCLHPKDLGDLLTPAELRSRRRAAVRAYFGTEATE